MLLIDSAEEPDALGDVSFPRKLLEACTVIAFANNHIDDIVVPAYEIRDRGDHMVMALVAFTRRHPPNGQQHSLAFDAPCSAQFMAVARSKPIRDRVGHDDDALGRDG